MQINRWEARRGLTWIALGWRVFKDHKPLWLTMALFYLLLALLLDQIPFIGYLVLVLITPLLASGALRLGGDLAGDAPKAGRNPTVNPVVNADWKEKGRSLTLGALKALFQTFYDPGKTLAVMVIATLLLGAVVVVQILAQLLKVGGSGLVAAGGVGITVWLPALLGLLLIWLLKTILVFIALYAVYLVTLREESPLAAIEHAGRASVQNAGAVAALALLLTLPLMLVGYFSALAFLLLGLIALPLLINSVYAGAKDIFG